MTCFRHFHKLTCKAGQSVEGYQVYSRARVVALMKETQVFNGTPRVPRFDVRGYRSLSALLTLLHKTYRSSHRPAAKGTVDGRNSQAAQVRIYN